MVNHRNNTPRTKVSISGVILAGGQGQRMGGVDKGWVPYQGVPMIERVVSRFQPQVDELIINANRSIDAYRALGLQVVPDIEGGFQGPMLGIATGLQAAQHDWVMFVPCDGPFLALDLVEHFYQAACESNAKIVVAADGEFLQPMVVLLHRQLLPNLLQALEEGERKPDRWYASVGMAKVVVDSDSLRNFNSLDQMNNV
ncbi:MULTISPECIES: molybdenum cofactor guanylyltransferase MobA [Nitrincola]|uniref:Molybdenum cofactor guanylyltransferase n=1 Tax=Nitrincola nitratireducens TaxID=1229521 RepID=W9URM9_9GAMM|nr:MULTISPECIES: molybdenum cofactor guanylyltransferase MobA [Nitrincola]EXJ09868.1 hypothetical protein D791_03196 [Nitrincola nitratireducens]